MTQYQKLLLAIFLGVWAWSVISPASFGVWLLENLLIFVFLPLIFLTARKFPLSSVSYTFILLFVVLHLIGAHWTYAEVPFGYVLQEWFDSSRNLYDRLVHFSFGLLLAYPIREIFMRLTGAKGIWGYYFPFDIVLSFSALYEVVEWLVVYFTDYAARVAYLGTQGDPWDPQKDIAAAAIGALISMLIVYFINLKFNRRLAEEIRESLRIKRRKPLGEDAISEMFEP